MRLPWGISYEYSTWADTQSASRVDVPAAAETFVTPDAVAEWMLSTLPKVSDMDRRLGPFYDGATLDGHP